MPETPLSEHIKFTISKDDIMDDSDDGNISPPDPTPLQSEPWIRIDGKDTDICDSAHLDKFIRSTIFLI